MGRPGKAGARPWQPALRRTMILSTKNKLVLLVAGSLILLAVGVGLFSMYSVKRTMLEEQRRSSVNTVALAAFNVTDRYPDPVPQQGGSGRRAPEQPRLAGETHHHAGA